MDYFYIASGIASLLAFFGFITTTIWPATLPKQVVLYGIAFTVVTLVFWLWFFFIPINKVRERIWERTIVTRFYSDLSTGVGVAEGELTIDGFDSKTVILPPYRQPPSITIYRDKAGDTLRITEITTDSFTVESWSSDQFGKWSFRARGELLTEKP